MYLAHMQHFAECNLKYNSNFCNGVQLTQCVTDITVTSLHHSLESREHAILIKISIYNASKTRKPS